MEERDIFWVKEVIENGEVEFNEAVFASDNPMMFRFNEYIVLHYLFFQTLCVLRINLFL